MAMGGVARVVGRVSLVFIALALLIAVCVYGFFRSPRSSGFANGRVTAFTTLGGRYEKRGHKVAICHHTKGGRYVKITVDRNALRGHRRHADIVPAPNSGCPGKYDSPSDTKHYRPKR
jgi:hypothetical protein